MLNVNNELPSYYPERRRYVRVQDAIGLHVQRLSDLAASDRVQCNETSVCVANKPIDKYSIQGYSQVHSDFPAVAEYICDLEEQVLQLSPESETNPLLPTHKVTLSTKGLSFSNRSFFLPDEIVSMVLTLFPSRQQIRVDAMIVSANNPDVETYKDRPTYLAEFLRMTDSDRRAIESHIDQLLSRCSHLDYTL